ncbi:hypothetical protein BYT27DRAFT_7201145 [Phlegmacium glaucopus]|nr:hypothetical protein BYT27DRAFT_7201145 [Phlegmacium glaucopus]
MAVVVIDDQDPALVYGSGWTHYLRAGSSNYNGTSSLSRSQGSRVTLQFNGISIAVYGTSSPNNTVVFTTVVDGSSALLTNVPTPTTTDQYRQLFFQSPPLSPGNHSFLLTNIMQDDWLWLDYFDITTDLPGSTSSSTVSAQVTTTTPPRSTNPPQNNTQSSSNHPQIAAIVGGTLGGIAMICVFVFGFLYLRRRRRPFSIDDDNPSTLGATSVTLTLPSPDTTPSSSNKNVHIQSRPVLVEPPPIYEEDA